MCRRGCVGYACEVGVVGLVSPIVVAFLPAGDDRERNRGSGICITVNHPAATGDERVEALGRLACRANRPGLSWECRELSNSGNGAPAVRLEPADDPESGLLDCPKKDMTAVSRRWDEDE